MDHARWNNYHDYFVTELFYHVTPAYQTDALQPVAGLPGQQRLRLSSTSALGE